MEKFPLKITSAVAIEGVIHKAESVVHVVESVARELLRRGKAVVHAAAEAVEHAAEVVEDATDDEQPTRSELDEALAALPDDHTDPEYVVNGMRSHFGDLFTADDEAKVRELVKADDADAVPPARSRKK